MFFTCEMEDWFEAEAEVADFERICLFDTLWEHTYSLPVLFIKEAIIKGIQRRTLEV